MKVSFSFRFLLLFWLSSASFFLFWCCMSFIFHSAFSHLQQFLFFFFSQLNFYTPHPRSWLSVIISLLCSAAQLSVSCLCFFTTAHWAGAAAIHLFVSHTDLSRIAFCKINILSSMPALPPFSCDVSSFPFVLSFFFLNFYFFVLHMFFE